MSDALQQLLEGNEQDFRAREQALRQRFCAPLEKPFVLFGAGRLGRTTLAGLRRAGVKPLAFADNDASLWGTQVEGVPVLSAKDAAAKFGKDTPFVVTIYTGAKVQQQLRDEGYQAIPFAALYLKYAETLLPHGALDLPHKMHAHVADICKGHALWADEFSRREYLAQVRYRLTLDQHLPPSLPPEDIYFPGELVTLTEEECFVDCGAFDGDSVRSFLQRRQAFGHIIALEPDPENCARLRGSVAALSSDLLNRVTVVQAAVGARRQPVRFESTGTAASSIQGGGTVEVDCLPLDELLHDVAPTYIKMDIEGAEPDALEGARDVIAANLPVLAICLYHKQEHLWQIPLRIQAISDQYRFFLRRYSDACWEQVCYAIPVERLRQ